MVVVVCLVAKLCLTLCNPVDCSPQAPLSMAFSRQEYWSGLPFSSPGDLPDPGMESASPMSCALAGRFFTTEPPYTKSLLHHYSEYTISHYRGTPVLMVGAETLDPGTWT